jgi:hypothetical protein
MNKNLFLIPMLIIFGLLVSSCNSSTTNPETPNPAGSIVIYSIPAGAQIWVDGTNSGKVTPDSVLNLSVGSHPVVLRLSGYVDDSFSMTVNDGFKTTVNRTLVSTEVISVYGPVRIWESADPSAADPSGIVLKSGLAVSIGTSTYGPVDIYYSSNGFVVATAYGLHNNTGRSTFFYVGSSNNLNDGYGSLLATSSWAALVTDTQANYFYLFDSDSHYSKMIITNRGGGTPGNPAWVDVEWIYNETPNDTRF